jgi:hypothetical protein
VEVGEEVFLENRVGCGTEHQWHETEVVEAVVAKWKIQRKHERKF